MAVYTTQIRTICEYLVQAPENQSWRKTIEQARELFFNFDYPFWEGGITKEQFEKDFLRHFYMSEIGAETPELFKMFLEDELNLIMPKYLPLANVLNSKIDILLTNDETETVHSNRNFDGKLGEKIIGESKDILAHESSRKIDESANENQKSNGQNSSTVTGESHSKNVSSATGTDTGKTSGDDTTDSTTTTNVNTLRKTLDGHSSTPQSSMLDAISLKYLDTVQTGEDKSEDDTTVTSNTQFHTTRQHSNDTSNHSTSTTTANDEAHTTGSTSASGSSDRTLNHNDNFTENQTNNVNQTTDRNQTQNQLTDEWITRAKQGRYGPSVAKLIGEYVENMASLEGMIFNELQGLFMLVYE